MMPIIRVVHDKDNPYVVMNKTGLNDPNLSFKAKGIHSYLLSRPDDWEVYVNHLAKQSKEGMSAVRSGLKELIKHGYATFDRKRNEDGTFEKGSYTVYETPRSSFPHVDKPNEDNRTLLSNDSLPSNEENDIIEEAGASSIPEGDDEIPPEPEIHPLEPQTQAEKLLFDRVNEERSAKRYRHITKFPSLACKARWEKCSAEVDISKVNCAVTLALQQGIIGLPKVVGYVESTLKSGKRGSRNGRQTDTDQRGTGAVRRGITPEEGVKLRAHIAAQKAKREREAANA